MINSINLGHSKKKHTPSGFNQKTHRLEFRSKYFRGVPTLKCLTDYLEIDFRSCPRLMRFLNFLSQKGEYNPCFWEWSCRACGSTEGLFSNKKFCLSNRFLSLPPSQKERHMKKQNWPLQLHFNKPDIN